MTDEYISESDARLRVRQTKTRDGNACEKTMSTVRTSKCGYRALNSRFPFREKNPPDST